MKQHLRLLIFTSLICTRMFGQCPGCTEKTTNLVINGDFEKGNTSFTSFYVYSTKLSMQMGGDYGIVKNASTWEPSFFCPSDHTGSGNMMLVNGVLEPDVTVWQQTISIKPNQTYYFAYWLANASAGSIPVIQLEINGVLQGSALSLNTTIGSWKQYFVTWNSGAATTAKLRIVNQNTNTGGITMGNNFAVDDITFFTCNPVLNPPKPKLGKDTVICNGNKLTLDAGAGFDTYKWKDGVTGRTRVVTTTGTYIVTTTYKGCEAADTIVVSADKSIYVNLPSDTVGCSGTPLQLKVQGNAEIVSWNTGQTTKSITVSTPGKYTVTGSSGKCSDTASVNVAFEMPFKIDLGNDTAFCSTDHLLDAGIAGKEYLWNTGEITQMITVSESGTYAVEVSSVACKAQDDIHLIFWPAPPANLGSDTQMCNILYTLDPHCEDCTYKWSTGETTETIQVNASGYYTVETTKNGCSSEDDINIWMIETPVVNLGNDTVMCGGNLVLDAGNPGNIYQWSTGETTQQILVNKTGKYKVTVGLQGCMDEDEIALTNYKVPKISPGPDTAFCAGETYQVVLPSEPAGYAYQWDNGSSSKVRVFSQSGTYRLKIYNAFCSYEDSMHVRFYEIPDVSIGNDTILCSGDSIRLHAGNSADKFHWNTGDTGRVLVAVKPGFYGVKASTYRCSDSADIIITGRAKPEIPLKDRYRICMEKNSDIVLDPGDDRMYYWRPAHITASSLSVRYPGVIICYYTDTNTCKAIKFINVEEGCDPYIWVPDAFSPDANNLNETFKPIGKYINRYHMEIYNRWGEKLFETDDLNEGWSGFYQGKLCEEEVYVWRIAYEGESDNQVKIGKHISGTVSLFQMYRY